MATANDPAPAARGAFVVLEGLDRSGKTTQVKLLQSRLIEAGRRVQLMRFPGESAWAFLSWWGLGSRSIERLVTGTKTHLGVHGRRSEWASPQGTQDSQPYWS